MDGGWQDSLRALGCTDGEEATALGKKQYKDLRVMQNTQESRKGRNSKSETVA